MDSSTLHRELAVAAHRCWCKRMLEEGWTPGEAFDPEAKVHDLIRPFDELSEFDQDLLCRWMRYDEVEEHMVMLLELFGRERELTTADLQVGTRVKLSEERAELFEEMVRRRGTVIDLTIADERLGRLDLIWVRWDDGDEAEYHVGEHAIVPLHKDEPQHAGA